MKIITRLYIVIIFAISAFIPTGHAANIYWDNGGADNNWSNPTNWTSDTPPITGDTVILENSAPDEAQIINLDTNVSLTGIRCNATGNRNYTIQSSNGSKLTLTGTYDVNGSVMTVDWNIDVDIITSGAEIRFYRSTNGTITVNGNIGPTNGAQQIWGQYTGELVLAGSNTAAEVRNYEGGEIVVKNTYALGNGTYRNYGDNGILSLATNAIIYNLVVSYPMNLRIKDAGSSDITLTVNGQATEQKVTVLPNAGGSTGKLKVKLTLGSTHHAEWDLTANSTLDFATASGVAGWGHSNPAYGGWVTGTGGVLIDCIGTARVDCYITNDFTGGLVITNGSIFLRGGNNRLPTNGNVTVYSGATLRLYGGVTQSVSVASGAGIINLDGGDLTVNGGIAPGDNGAGTLTIDGGGNLILVSSATSTFELDNLAETSDKVTFSSSLATLTLAGTLNIENLGHMETGDYKLFDLNGGAVSGGFSNTNMPNGFLGEVAVAGGDVIITVTLAPQGTVVLVK